MISPFLCFMIFAATAARLYVNSISYTFASATERILLVQPVGMAKHLYLNI